MLSLNQVSLRRGAKLLFEGASLQLHAGQRLGLTGANGSGKSSLFALLMGRLESDAGELVLPEGGVISHVRQESPDSSQTALDYVLDGDRELRGVLERIAAVEAGRGEDRLERLYERMEAIQGFSAEARAARLLDGLGFAPGDVSRTVREFSGGWRMRLNLAQALMCRSDILLLDEPTNHLDLPAILWLERTLQRYAGILLVISHDRDFLDRVCTRIAHIERQEVRLYTGNYSQFEAQRAEQLAQQQALHIRQQKEVRHLQSFVDRFRYKASKARQAQSRLKMMERMTRIAPAHVDSPFRFRFEAPEKQPQHLLRLDGASVGYARDEAVLSGIDLNVSGGDRLGLLGVNGAGKSTLVKALASGATLLEGDRVLSRDTRIGYFAQHQLELLEPDHSPADHLLAVAPGERESELRSYLGRFGFSGERIFEPVAPFSGGEKARLVLALMIRRRPNLLLLDEPTNHLDLEMRQALALALMEYDGALVVISHDRHLLRSVCDELLIVHDGGLLRFDRSLDEYPDWLREQQAQEARDEAPDAPPPAGPSRREQRREEAQRRQALKPLTDRVRAIEGALGAQRMKLEMLEKRLAEESLYTDASRQEELAELARQQSACRESISALEWDWLEASQAVENATGAPDPEGLP